IGFKGKAMLLLSIFAGFFSKEAITEEELDKMKSQDMIDSVLQEFTNSLPKLKEPLINDRDQFLSQKIKSAPGKKIVAVLGAAHVPGIKKEIEKEHDLKRLSERPPKSKLPKIIGWAIPIIILSIIAYTFYANFDAGVQ